MSNLSTLPKGDSAWLLRKSIQRVMQQVSVLETNIGTSTTGNSANTQIIFNDNGTLRGDPDLTFNTVLNRLVANNIESTAALLVGTSATITGNLTVDTNTLFVDSANDRVGIGTATPAAKLIVRDGLNRNLLVASDSTQLGSSGIAIGGFTDGAAGYAPLSIISSSTQFGISGSTAMTLNSTGLGIGVTPSAKLDVVVPGTGSPRVRFNGDSDNPFIEFQRFQGTGSNFFGSRVQGMFGGMAFWVSNAAAIGSQTFTQAMTLDASGNLILQSSATPATLTTNGQLTVNATSNTNLRFSYRGSDGVTRVANITLA